MGSAEVTAEYQPATGLGMGGIAAVCVGASVLMDSPEDAEKRIADLEHQLDQQRRIAELERQLAQARAEPPPGATGANVDDLLGALSGLRLGSGGGRFSGAAFPPRTPVDTRLSAAPRRVPLLFLLAELLPFRWWYLTAMFLVAVPGAIAWATTPALTLPVAALTLVLIYAWQLVGTRTRLQLLKWGQVATVTGAEIASRASYYGGVTWYNAPLPVASGWRVTRPLWSGPSTKTDIRYALNGYQGELRVRGREYVDGVILADQRHPDRARCVTYFPYDLDRDDTGDWVGRLRPRLVVGMVIWLVVVLGWLAVATAISTGYATHALQRAQVITIDAGASARVSGNSINRGVTCNGGHLTVDGNENVVTVTGHCATLTVTGIDNTVAIDAVDTILISGIDGHVTYHAGAPVITNSGIDNTATRG